MSGYKGTVTLKNKLISKQARVAQRYRYYEMKNAVIDNGRMIPDDYRWLTPVIGWCAKAVDALADRLVFDTFDNDNFYVNEIYEQNNNDILFDSAILSALISSCCFIYISAGADGYPRLQVIDGGNATGIIDPITNMLKEGYAVLERDSKTKRPTAEAYFTADETFYIMDGQKEFSVANPAPYPLLVPIINRPDAVRPFGHSRISRACMEYTQSALRTLRRSEISAEFYSLPQKYVVGMGEEAEFNNRFATYSSFLRIDKDEDGDHPVIGQFNPASMTPFLNQLQEIASLFAGETGLTLDDLGFSSSNPSSSEAIKAAHENLRMTARKAQRSFTTGFLNVGYLAACLRDNFEYKRSAFTSTLKGLWLPVFEPDSSALGAVGDAIYKINEAVPDYIGAKNMKQLTGLDGDNA